MFQREEWHAVTTKRLAGFATIFALFLLLVFKCEPGFIFVIDHANLLFHEAGHPLIGFFSDRLAVYGGTIGQLTFPVVLAISFWRKGQTLSFAGAVIWFFENWLNIARYMADARAQVLPLVGGNEHDWFHIFSNWRVLGHDTRIAVMVKTMGWIGIGTACVWVGWRYFVFRKSGGAEDSFETKMPSNPEDLLNWRK